MDSLHLSDLKMEMDNQRFQDDLLHYADQPISMPELFWPLIENPDPDNKLYQFPFQYPWLPPVSQNNSFDDCEVDFRLWCNNLPSLEEGGVIDAVPLNIIANSTHGSEGLNIEFNDKLIEIEQESSSWGSICKSSEEKTSYDKSNGRLRSSDSIEFDDIRRYFYVPITQAAKELKVGLTVLKKRCRELGISRWPNRKMNSLRSLIHNVKRIGHNGEQVKRLEELKRLLERKPEIQLSEETKKLRQACFKANYKRRIMDAALS